MQMTLYSYHNIILMKGTYSEIFVKIRHDDVILRHVTSFCYIPRKCCWQTADVCKKYPVWVNQYRFFAKNITRAFIWGVNHLSTIIGSLFIAVAVEVPILLILLIFDDKNADISKKWTLLDFFLVKILSSHEGWYSCQVSSCLPKNSLN